MASVEHPNPKRARHEFCRLAFQYYVAGRFAFFARLLPVAGNLLHHAVEMFIKGFLVLDMPLDDLRTDFSHNLESLWTELKGRAPKENLAEFDKVISTLHAFDKIRYPERVLVEGMELTFGITEAPIDESGSDITQRPPRYSLVLHEMDRLVRRLLEVASVNPKVLPMSLSAEGRDFLTRDNPCALDYEQTH